MKNLIIRLLCAVILHLSHMSLNAQCAIYSDEILDKFTDGQYLMHIELNNSNTPKATLQLQADHTYSLYLLNASLPIEQYKLASSSLLLESSCQIINKKENYSLFILQPKQNLNYEFTLTLESDDQNCVLFTLYYPEQQLKRGWYQNFDELRHNNPIASPISTVKMKKGDFNTHYYVMQTKPDQKLYGFCDGSNIYLNGTTLKLNLANNYFIKGEKIGPFLYFNTSTLMLIGSNIFPTPIEKLLHMQSGELVTLNNNMLKEIIASDPVLLEQFKTEKNKNKDLKGYLTKFYSRSTSTD